MNMIYRYHTPEGFSDMLMTEEEGFLTSLQFEHPGQEEIPGIDSQAELPPVLLDTVRWLDLYFSGKDPGFTPAYRIHGLTDFRNDVSQLMLEIPLGQLSTYGELARKLAERRGLDKMSARAVGGAVGWNPICIIIPCHRVIGSSGSLTGYGGGIGNKVNLLRLEGHDMSQYTIPVMDTDK